jgi:3-hydroxybutyryl-CoA dehydrogenase
VAFGENPRRIRAQNTTILAQLRADCYESEMNAEGLTRVAVIGAGQMGGGIAQVLCVAGIEVSLCDVSEERAQASVRAILSRLERLSQKGKLDAAKLERSRALLAAKGFEEALAESELVIEAASEDPTLKRELFVRADARAPAAAILASNTSSISITRLGAATKRPERVIGMHFMNPVPVMKLVEVVRGVATSERSVDFILGLCRRLEKTPIVSADSPGFLVNRMLLPFLNEACFALQEGVGTAEDIDQGARLGLNHPLGPLELADLIGLDTVLAIAEVLHRDLGDDKYRPATLLRNLVAAGYLGKKSGRGFYSYDEQGQKKGSDR